MCFHNNHDNIFPTENFSSTIRIVPTETTAKLYIADDMEPDGWVISVLSRSGRIAQLWSDHTSVGFVFASRL